MPELPEVEIIKQQLSTHIIGKKVLSFYTSGKALRKPISELWPLIGQQIKSIARRNKYLVLEFETSWLLIHLGMTGQFIVEEDSKFKHLADYPKHTHVVFQLSDNYTVRYVDPRRFGLVQLYDKSEYPLMVSLPPLRSLGIEPLDKNFNLDIFTPIVKSSSQAIKKVLMDSSKVCGLGNIYANELLFIAKIDPQRKSSTLKANEIKNLYEGIVPLLNRAIALGGSSISDYVNATGEKGNMQLHYKVYNRAGELCYECSNKIKKINQGGRSSFFCDKCQH